MGRAETSERLLRVHCKVQSPSLLFFWFSSDKSSLPAYTSECSSRFEGWCVCAHITGINCIFTTTFIFDARIYILQMISVLIKKKCFLTDVEGFQFTVKKCLIGKKCKICICLPIKKQGIPSLKDSVHSLYTQTMKRIQCTHYTTQI